MKNLRKNLLFVTLILGLIISGCTAVTPETPSATEIGLTLEETTPIPAATLAPVLEVRFTIVADEDLKTPVSALYSAFFPGETPSFVESGGDLRITRPLEGFEDRPVIPTTFLPQAEMVPLTDSQDIRDFIDFAISVDGQETLIEAGELPSSFILTDQSGKTIEIDQPIRRVISAYGPATALVYTVGAEERLVSASYLGARDPLGAAVMEKIDPRFPAILGEEFFTQDDFNIEQAASLDPDLILTSARSAWLEAAGQLDIPVFLFEAETTTLLKEAILSTGQLFGPYTTTRAKGWVAYYDQIVNTVREQTSDLPEENRVRVLFTGTDPLRVASGDMYQTEIIEAAGGISVTSELTGYWNNVNLEQVVIWDPDVIIVPPYGGATVEAITESTEWQALTAVQAGRVYRMPKLVVPWDTPAPDSVLGIVWMGQRLYPDRVDLQCSDEAEYFYNTFYNYPIAAEEIESICRFE